MASYPTGPKGAAKSSLSETNNHLQGRSGSGTMKKTGPAYSGKGGDLGNSSNGGGINRPTKASSKV